MPRRLFGYEPRRVSRCATARSLIAATPTGQDYWSLAGAVDLSRNATGRRAIKKAEEYTVVGQNAARVDLAAKVFGEAVFVHDMMLDGMAACPRRAPATPRRDDRDDRRGRDPPRRQRPAIEIVRDGNFVAILGADETVVEAVAAVAPAHVAWDGVDPLSPFQEEARWLLQQPSLDREVGAPPADPVPGATRREASFTRMNLSHASIAPSCGVAVYRDGRLEVWTHSQGVYPLRAALARTLKLDPAAIVVHHAQGPGCYGHNGADDAAADAAVIAMHRPGVPVRVRWRREEEFGFEPVSTAMVTSVRAVLDADGRPADWTTEIWSGRHTQPARQRRQSAGRRSLARPAAGRRRSPNPPAQPGAGTRNGEPLYDFAAKRISHHLIPETPVRTSSLRGLGATLNVFAIESFVDELAARSRRGPGRLPPVDPRRPARPRGYRAAACRR